MFQNVSVSVSVWKRSECHISVQTFGFIHRVVSSMLLLLLLHNTSYTQPHTSDLRHSLSGVAAVELLSHSSLFPLQPSSLQWML